MLEARAIRKQFPGVLALDDVSLRLGVGEALALVGENGAGKSTLMKILAGVYQPDAGTLTLRGQPIKLPNVRAATAAGICLIHQELNLAENLSVAANLFLGREKLYAFTILNRGAMRREARDLLKRVGLDPELVDVTVETLAPGQKQLVEIARALSVSARVIIMDEPTSSLTQTETDRLYEVIDDVKRSGVSVVYISHRLAEVKRIADRATILRDGRNAGELAKADITHDNLVKLMVGREMKQLYPRSRPQTIANEPALRLENLHYTGRRNEPVTLEVYPGEILGMAGLVGAGRTELAEAVFGLRTIDAGTISLAGQRIRIRTPVDAIDAGIGMVPEDRRLHGLILAEGSGFNVSLPNLPGLSTFGLVSRAQEFTMAQEWVNRLRIKTPSLRQPVGLLSGGNQQKVVFAKWLARQPKVLILDEPTRGVDVGAREEIYKIIDELAASGLAVWMITSDLEELLGMSDRVAVMHESRLAGILTREQLSEEAVMRLATGGSGN